MSFKNRPTLKNKITPLFLLGQIKKGGITPKDRQSALNLLEEEHKKIASRYGKITNKFTSSTNFKQKISIYSRQLLNKSQVLSKEGGNDEQQKSLSALLSEKKAQSKQKSNKIDEIVQRHSSKKKARFHSMIQKRSNMDFISESSPYLNLQRNLSVEKKRSETEVSENNMDQYTDTNLQSNKQCNIVSVLKQRLQNRIKLQAKNSQFVSVKKNRELCEQIEFSKIQKIFSHFQNIYNINVVLENKKKDREVLPYVRKYVLDESGNPSCIEDLYVNQQDCKKIRKLMFMERFVVIMMVDLIINCKLKIVQIYIRASFRAILGFYSVIYKDLEENNKIKENSLPQIVQELQKQNQYSTFTFSLFIQSISSKIKTCNRFSKYLESYYKQNNKQISLFNTNLSYFRLLQYYSQCLLTSNCSMWNIDFLETCPSPYLHQEGDKKYTLVLDLDETLIHYKMTNGNTYKGQFLIRPYMFQFLQKMSEFFELGIFTCSVPQYADVIINHMKTITFRLYRHHTIKINGEFVKDLSRIGRKLETTILVDNLQQNFRMQKFNGIHVRSWYGDRNDDILKLLGEELIRLAKIGVEDLRRANFTRKFL